MDYIIYIRSISLILGTRWSYEGIFIFIAIFIQCQVIYLIYDTSSFFSFLTLFISSCVTLKNALSFGFTKNHLSSFLSLTSNMNFVR